MTAITGFIYYLQNPTTDEIFYVGSTECSLKNRLRTHYQHLREFERNLRKTNRRYEYLLKLRPLKATIHLLELVFTKEELEKREIFYIKHFRKINSNLTNMTDGGKGKCTSKYYTEKELEIYSLKISKSNKGRPKPKGFAENLSQSRKGLNNPAAKQMLDWIIAFKDEKPIKLLKYGFKINEFIDNKYDFGAVKDSIKRNGTSHNYKWEYFSKCSKEIQDIVQLAYENEL